jgi:hypothetical protein
VFFRHIIYFYVLHVILLQKHAVTFWTEAECLSDDDSGVVKRGRTQIEVNLLFHCLASQILKVNIPCDAVHPR